MRLRNVKNADVIVNNSDYVINNPKEYIGNSLIRRNKKQL